MSGFEKVAVPKIVGLGAPPVIEVIAHGKVQSGTYFWVVVRGGRIIARAYNQVELLKDATAHAEMLALTQAEAAVGMG